MHHTTEGPARQCNVDHTCIHLHKAKKKQLKTAHQARAAGCEGVAVRWEWLKGRERRPRVVLQAGESAVVLGPSYSAHAVRAPRERERFQKATTISVSQASSVDTDLSYVASRTLKQVHESTIPASSLTRPRLNRISAEISTNGVRAISCAIAGTKEAMPRL
jgi:hypothetical protein